MAFNSRNDIALHVRECASNSMLGSESCRPRSGTTDTGRGSTLDVVEG